MYVFESSASIARNGEAQIKLEYNFYFIFILFHLPMVLKTDFEIRNDAFYLDIKLCAEIQVPVGNF